MTNTNTNINLIKDELVDFVKTTILGFENGLYNHMGSNASNEYFKFVLVQFTVEHYNNIYKSLVIQDNFDTYSVEKINK